MQNELQTALVQERTQCEALNEHLAELDAKHKQRVQELELRLEASEVCSLLCFVLAYFL